jgi:aldehyde:ferredoxin oxidoreductase
MQPIIRVDLSTYQIDEFTIPLDWENEYLGGASLAARLLYEDLIPEVDPLSQQAPLLFMTGPLTGTAGPAVGRFVVCGKSPATGLWGESNCGGFWGPELRMAGFDGLLIRGRSEQPVYLCISDNHIEIRPAEQIWGLDTYSTQSYLQNVDSLPQARIACIGQAGEALIPYSLILCDHGRVAGRTGMGAVMGSKNLKAITVQGTGKIPVGDIERFLPLRSESNRMLRDDSVSKVARELGTASIADYMNYLHELPKKYFSRGTLNEDIKISGAYMKETILVGFSACHACVIACGRVVALEDGEKRKGPEYETLAGFGPNLLVDDPVAITRLGELCDRYGMDSISISNTIGLAFTLFERGIIGVQETGGLELNWGQIDTIEKLVHLTVQKRGFGEILALGAQGLGRYYNSEAEAVHVNGLEVAYHDPRGASGMSLVYATSPRGACHNQSDYFLVEIGHCYPTINLEFYPLRGGMEKSANVARHQDWRTIFNSLVMCFFANVPPESVLELVNSACKLNMSIEELLLIGERGWNLKRIINNRLGVTKENDTLPKALLIPYEDDPDKFVPDFYAMLAAYYNYRGWDPNTGFPLEQRLSEIGLEWAIRDLHKPIRNEGSPS